MHPHDVTNIITGIIRENDSVAMLSDTLKQASIVGCQCLLYRQAEETFKWLDKRRSIAYFPVVLADLNAWL